MGRCRHLWWLVLPLPGSSQEGFVVPSGASCRHESWALSKLNQGDGSNEAGRGGGSAAGDSAPWIGEAAAPPGRVRPPLCLHTGASPAPHPTPTHCQQCIKKT